MRIFLAVLVLVTGGCTTTKKPISIREVVDDIEGETSVVDTKIAKYRKLIEQFPNEPKHRERLAAFYWQKEDHINALKQLKIARRLDPENTKYDYLEGQIQQAIGNFGQAEVSYKKVIAKLPEESFTGPHFTLADLYLETDRIEKAKGELELCCTIDPADPLPYYYLGTLAYDEKEWKSAIKFYERYMELGGRRYHDLVRRRLVGMQPNLGRVRYTGE